MRVLFVSQEFPPETGWGGIGTYAGTIAPALVRAGAEVHALSVVDGQKRSSRVVDGVHVHRAPVRRIPGVGRVTRLPETARRIAIAGSVLREQRRLGLDFDVCESPEWYAEALGIALRRRIPLVVRVHSGARQMFPLLGPINRDRALAIRCEEATIRRADVVTGTKSLTSDVAMRLGISADGIRSIICPVSPLPRLALPTGPPRIAFIGRFEARKGPDTLLRAVPRIADRIPGVRVVLRGRDTQTSTGDSYLVGLRRLARELGVCEIVEFTDAWSPNAVVDEMTKAHVCAVPSRWESFGLVAAEACALGRPVVASGIPGLDEVVVDGVTGRLAPVDDAAAFGDALADLLASPEVAERMGSAAAADIATRCDPARVAIETLQAYELAIGRHQSAGGRR
jgi:glycogen(starch) synthase